MDEIIIKDFKSFKLLLYQEISKYNIDDSLPLRKILGKSIRRLKSKTQELEKELQDKINSGNCKYLVLGEVKPHPDPKMPDEQYYIIKSLTFDLDDLNF